MHRTDAQFTYLLFHIECPLKSWEVDVIPINEAICYIDDFKSGTSPDGGTVF